MNDLQTNLCKLSEKGLQVKIITGYRDASGGYAWHTVFFISIYKTIEYCQKCRDNYNVNYKDDYDMPHRHSHRHELQVVYCDTFINFNELEKKLGDIVLEYEVLQPHKAR